MFSTTNVDTTILYLDHLYCTLASEFLNMIRKRQLRKLERKYREIVRKFMCTVKEEDKYSIRQNTELDHKLEIIISTSTTKW